jgi:hypothetical protein
MKEENPILIRTLQLLGLAALVSTAVLADQWSKTFAVSGKPELRVEAGDGAVSVRVWDRKEIEARVTTVGWTIGRGEVQVIDHQKGDRVELELRLPRFSGFLQRRSVRLDLRVPRDLRSDIRTADGRISVESLHGETRLATGDGSIEAESLDGTLDASTGDGRIRARGRFDVLALHTGDGSVEADIGAGSRMTSDWNVRTGDGHVTLGLPADFAADLDVRTGDGHIESDLPAITPVEHREHEFRGKLNAGGRLLTVRTNDGSVRLERR